MCHFFYNFRSNPANLLYPRKTWIRNRACILVCCYPFPLEAPRMSPRVDTIECTESNQLFAEIYQGKCK